MDAGPVMLALQILPKVLLAALGLTKTLRETSMSRSHKDALAANNRIVLGFGFMTLVGFLIGTAFEDIVQWNVPTRALAGAQHKEFVNYDKDKYWTDKIRAGGYILYVRHAQREKWEDVTGFDMVELATKTDASKASYKKAVCLTERGIEESKLIGQVFRLARVKA